MSLWSSQPLSAPAGKQEASAGELAPRMNTGTGTAREKEIAQAYTHIHRIYTHTHVHACLATNKNYSLIITSSPVGSVARKSSHSFFAVAALLKNDPTHSSI